MLVDSREEAVGHAERRVQLRPHFLRDGSGRPVGLAFVELGLDFTDPLEILGAGFRVGCGQRGLEIGLYHEGGWRQDVRQHFVVQRMLALDGAAKADLIDHESRGQHGQHDEGGEYPAANPGLLLDHILHSPVGRWPFREDGGAVTMVKAAECRD